MEAAKKAKIHESHACNLMNIRSYQREEERSFTFSDDKNSLLAMIFMACAVRGFIINAQTFN